MTRRVILGLTIAPGPCSLAASLEGVTMKTGKLKIGVGFCVLVCLSGCGNKRPLGPHVVVQRGAYNQPSLFVVGASTPQQADSLLFEEQGYVEAQDRFLQMDMSRRLARGKTSELLGGDKAIRMDLQVISMGLPQAVQRSEAKVRQHQPEIHLLLQAFARGVNRYLSEMPLTDPDLLNRYRRITGDKKYVPDAWEPADSLGVGENVLFYLSSHFQDKISNSLIALKFAEKKDPFGMFRWLDLRPLENVFILDADKKTPRGELESEMTSALGVKWTPELQRVGEFNVPCVERGFPFGPCKPQGNIGSNNWVVSSQFAGGNYAYVANDTHLALTAPSIFYEIALDSKSSGGTIRARGVGFPGTPGIMIGHNDRIAWAMTNQPADVDDVYLEVASQDKTEVSFKGSDGKSRMVKVQSQPHSLKIRHPLDEGFLEERVIQLRTVPHHGPVVSDHISDIREAVKELEKQRPGETFLVSYRWVGHEGTGEGGAAIGLNRAGNFQEFKRALDLWEVGAQNIIYGDVDGNIGYYSHAKFPLRKYLLEWAPYVPVWGVGEREWEATWSGPDQLTRKDKYRSQVPTLYNPQMGRIVTANNDPYGTSAEKAFSNYKDYFGYNFASGVRAKRITELLDAKKGNLNIEDMAAIQRDHKDLMALKFVGILREAYPLLKLSGSGAAVAEKLLNWDGLMTRDSNEPVIVYEWLDEIQSEYFKQLVDKKNSPPQVSRIRDTVFMIKTAFHTLNDGLHTASERPQVIEILTAALESTGTKFEKTEWAQLRWGQKRRLKFFNPLEGILPTQGYISIERDGSPETVDVAGSVYGPGFRMVLKIPTTGTGKIEGVNVMAGGNYAPGAESAGWLKELFMWRDGKNRELVPFVR